MQDELDPELDLCNENELSAMLKVSFGMAALM